MPTTSDLCSPNFWRLFHNMLRHGNTPDDIQRAKDGYTWTIDKSTTIRKINGGDEMALIGAIWKCSSDDRALPGYSIVKDYIEAQTQNEGLLTQLEEYESIVDTLQVHALIDLDQVLRDKANEWETEHFAHILKKGAVINSSGVQDKKTGATLIGPREAINFVMRELEKGVLVDVTNECNRPVLVQNEAKNITERYEERVARGWLDTGIPQIRVYPSDFLGILGYTGSGKSTLARFMAYQIAQQGHNVLHISLENDAIVENDKYVLLHAHNQERWGDEFSTLSYEAYKLGTLNQWQKDAMKIVGDDFEKSIGGKIIIRQPQTFNWAHTREIIEMTHATTPLSVVLLDYIQLLESSSKNGDEYRIRTTQMIKDIRQFFLTFSPQKKIACISPAQANEEGLKKAAEKEGVWSLSGVNNDKELARSMSFLVGVFDCGLGEKEHRQVTTSCIKDRDGIGFTPFNYSLSSCGWISTSNAVMSSVDVAERATKMVTEFY